MTKKKLIWMMRQAGKRFSAHVAEVEPHLADLQETVILKRTRGSLAKLQKGAPRLGGVPDLPATVDWPNWKKTTSKESLPRQLNFLAQIRLKDLAGRVPESGVPEDGWLCFFYDTDEQPWGNKAEQGAFRVLYVEGKPKDLVRRKDGPRAAGHSNVPYTIKVQVEETLPRRLPKSVSQEARIAYSAVLRAGVSGSGKDPLHRAFCSADEVQGSEEVDAEITGGSRKMKCGKDKVLLLQLDSDKKLGWQWGDEGRLYFWITRADLRKWRFDRAWGELQSH